MKDKPISSYRISEYAKKFASYSKYHSIDIHENNIEQMTVHTSKGKEADYVVVFDMNKGGFPSEKSTNPLLELLLPKSEPYKHAEERRLFYVALTRARHHVYLITDASKPSPFVVEVIDNGYPILTDEFHGERF